MLRRALIACALATHVPSPLAQLLPMPNDGEIRQVYFEVQNRSEVWLTLTPKTAKGDAALTLTFTFHVGGTPGTAPKDIEVRAFASMWTPRSDLVFVLDDAHTIDLFGTFVSGGMPSDYTVGSTTIAVLRQMAGASRIRGNALGFNFELSQAQRKAIAAFLDKISNCGPLYVRCR